MTESREGFTFEHAGRTYTCHQEALGPTRDAIWWWFTVSSEEGQRYAAFAAEPDDTPATVEARIVAYHDHRLARRAEPSGGHWRRGRPATPATPAAAVEPPAAS